MPEFSNPFDGLKKDRKLTHEELIRAIRFLIAAEYEATQMYMQLAESTDNELAKAVLKDIAEEIHMDVSTVSRVANSKYVQSSLKR